MAARNLALTIEYDGTAYCGWQIQENGPTVQAAIEKAIRKLTGETVSVTGCSRTDAGVHAHGFVLNFHTDSTIPAENFALAMNAFLPPDISVRFSGEVPDAFHARFDAKEKTYRYLFYPAVSPSALLATRAWHIKMPELARAEDAVWQAACAKMQRAADFFVGTHDFTAFRAVGSHVKTTVRTIYRADVSVLNDDLITGTRLFCFEVSGNGFLYNMVRIMAGTLQKVLAGAMEPEEVGEALTSGMRKNAGQTAPAHGLYLEKVRY